MSNPFAMSFDDLKAQADENMKADKGQSAAQSEPAATNAAVTAPQTQTQTSSGKSFLDMVNDAERQLAENEGAGKAAEAEPVKEDVQSAAGIPSGVSFDDMFNQAQGSTSAAAPSFEDLFNQATNNQAAQTTAQATAQTMAQTETTAQTTAQTETKGAVQETVQAPLSFEEMLAQAQAQTNTSTQQSATPSFDDVTNQAKTEAPAEEPKVEAPAEEPNVETPVEEAKTEAPVEEPKAETPVEEPKVEAPVEEPKAEKATAKKGTKKSGKAKEEKAPVEPLPDTTDDFKVDLTGGAKTETKEPEAKAEGALVMETLFTPEEIGAFRADIRTFVRSEFKKAMVGAMKDLLADFNE